ncbi:putative membrane protein [Raineyella antarctica]|uniref:Putative membrane protein n=1 Tax=Raineyella antarctica TaxID=1577474 RepID=A0A1G6HH43_9ACTN|nr:hypothetical protein [Raineyella antarctica]SDB93562.1 putative membrane protein [Raineyella antarctica]
MHPFYEPNARQLAGRGTSASGLLSMAAYLAFWAVALVIVRREVDARFPKGRISQPDTAMVLLRERFARGEIDQDQFRAMTAVLQRPAPTPG